MKIDFTKAMMTLDEMFWVSQGKEGNSRKQLALAPMKDLLENEMTYASQFYLSDEEWEDCFRCSAPNNTEIQQDADAIVSIGDDEGAYVQCWVWVSASEARVVAQRLVNARNK